MAPAELRVWVCYAPADSTPDLVELRVPPGSTMGAAVAASGVLMRHPEAANVDIRWAVDGKRVQANTLLRPDDRVDLCRQLLVDPMQARRLRAEAARRQLPKKTR